MILGSGLIQAANTFVGAYDAIPSITAAYSTRRLLTRYEGPLLRLVADRTGYPEHDIGYTAAGDLDTAAAASFLAGDTGYITKWYDQSGNALDATQATLANMPLYVASGQNSKPVLRGNGTSQYLQNVNAAWDSIKYTVTAIAALSITSSVNVRAFSCGSTAFDAWECLIGPSSTTGYVSWNHGGVLALAAAGWVAFAGRCDGATNSMWVDGVAGTPAAFSSTFGTVDRFAIFARRSVLSHYNGDVGEVVICAAALSTSDREAAQSAANAYWSLY